MHLPGPQIEQPPLSIEGQLKVGAGFTGEGVDTGFGAGVDPVAGVGVGLSGIVTVGFLLVNVASSAVTPPGVRFGHPSDADPQETRLNMLLRVSPSSASSSLAGEGKGEGRPMNPLSESLVRKENILAFDCSSSFLEAQANWATRNTSQSVFRKRFILQR